MRFTKIPDTTFKQIQLNSGILLSEFDPKQGEYDPNNILGATSGGVSFEATPEFSDYGEDIDNCPKNMKELKVLDNVEAKMSGSFVTVSDNMIKLLIGAADTQEGKITPRRDLVQEDFTDVWWVGDYSDNNSEETGGFIAVHLLNSLSTGGFKIKSSDKGKGNFDFEFTGHYSMAEQDRVPYEVYISDETSAEGLAAKEPVKVTTSTVKKDEIKN